MKCPMCGGTAYAYGCEDENGKMPIRCPWCGYSEVQTNEEWFCNLPTEDKAKEMCVIMADMAEANDGVWDEEMIEEWLKEVHKE